MSPAERFIAYARAFEETYTDDSFSVSWQVTYGIAGAPPCVLRCRSTARYDNSGLIVHLVDAYPPGTADEVSDWVSAHGRDLQLDPSYA